MKKIVVIGFIFIFINVVCLPLFIFGIFEIFDKDTYKIEIYNSKSNKIIKIELEEYLKGVVAAEMPADFEVEALKAQAIAARTYTIKKLKTGSITTDSNIDQAWLSEEELEDKWGRKSYHKYWDKISAAVDKTKGLVLTYKQELISAVYHSASGLYTEDAVAVWGNKVPYLRSVTSNYEKKSPYYRTEKIYTIDDISNALDLKLLSLDQISIIKRTNTGRVSQAKIGGEYFSGKELRDKLELPSTYFIIKNLGDKIKMISSGYGHGVGMSQYGANGMAKRGYDYREILLHYYPGVKIKLIR